MAPIQSGIRAIALAASLAAGIALWPAPASAQEGTAERELTAAGLVSVGKYWVPTAEIELRRTLETIPKLDRVYFAARDKYVALRSDYDNLRGQLVTARESIERNRIRSGEQTTNAATRQQLDGDYAKLSEQATRLEKEIRQRLDALDEASSFAKAAVELVNARNELGLAVLEARRRIESVDASYVALGGVEKFRRTAEGISGALGPVENYRKRTSRELSRLEQEVFGDGVPLYRCAGQMRLSLIVAERTAATFSFVNSKDPTLVPASLVQRAGIKIDESQPAQTVEWGAAKLQVRPVVLPQLRIGKCVLSDVEAFVLPPEAEDLGARISVAPFGSHPPSLDERRLWFDLGE